MMDGHVTPRGAGVLDELELDPGHVVKAKLALRIHKTIVELGLRQREAAARMPITQPKLSLLMRGRLAEFSLEKLEGCLRALGHDIEIAIEPQPR
jgi:predicted XRE-type DNA-binding protein